MSSDAAAVSLSWSISGSLHQWGRKSSASLIFQSVPRPPPVTQSQLLLQMHATLRRHHLFTDELVCGWGLGGGGVVGGTGHGGAGGKRAQFDFSWVDSGMKDSNSSRRAQLCVILLFLVCLHRLRQTNAASPSASPALHVSGDVCDLHKRFLRLHTGTQKSCLWGSLSHKCDENSLSSVS